MKPILPIAISLTLLCPALAAPSSGTVLLNEQGVKNLGIETVTVERADFEITTFALGRTEAIPENRSALSSRIPGRVVENRIEIGEFVEKGTELLLIESRQPGNPPPTVWLTAPADGNIISMATTLGAPVDPSDRLAEIADLRRLYLVVRVPQSTAGKIKQGTQARVRFPIRPDKEYSATLRRHTVCDCPDPSCALGLDMSSRDETNAQNLNSAGVVFTIENPHSELRPQMHAECSIILESRSDVLSVPREAVHGGPGERHVFIRHHTIPHAFERVSVTTGATGNGRVEILDGLFEGDEVVTRGSYSLGFAGNSAGVSIKEAMDMAHGHEHNEDGSEKTPEQLAAAADGDGHGDHGDNHLEVREMIFMAATAILAIALIVSLRRRGGSDPADSSNRQAS